MTCEFGKAKHKFRVVMNCYTCNRHEEYTVKLRCRAHEYKEVHRATPREIGCNTCKRQMTLYFFCKPKDTDWDSVVRHRNSALAIRVWNVDHET